MCYRPRVLSGYDRIFIQETRLKWQFGGHGGGGGGVRGLMSVLENIFARNIVGFFS